MERQAKIGVCGHVGVQCIGRQAQRGPNSKLFVMEFELEVDVLNPLYPPVSQPEATNPASPGQNASGFDSDSITAGEASNDGMGRTSLGTGDMTSSLPSSRSHLGDQLLGYHTSPQPSPS